eukprot:CAMPEP_0181250602 /NCGR_PEP_ID=MMETSP1096-20121128/46411_1 /TAXON_ID=156174 ORGANISM="Chrysochromulina ericina, Strain CCMP281" /NCGR_SAMPLE_ID=MMETSP1096 /ASSEMBLY_ACC=CAM_ASM_000453 /LENGTH=66 /DNA_ID=CAMNT_0023348089 /DNA_START=543 /DNA_END=743 /DNA_ORIENTATION=-
MPWSSLLSTLCHVTRQDLPHDPCGIDRASSDRCRGAHLDCMRRAATRSVMSRVQILNQAPEAMIWD